MPVVLDSDVDGMLDDEDQCLETEKGVVIDEFGCDNLQGIVDGLVAPLQFDKNTSHLTQVSHAELDSIAEILKAGMAINVEVNVYAEDINDVEYIKGLSKHRAESVIAYLLEKGIAAERMLATGYEKEKPVVEANSVATGAQNPLVEFILTTY